MEIWKPTPYPDYDASNLGRVRSLGSGVPVVLTPKTDRLGYLWLSLRINGKNKRCLVHRLVAETFMPNPDNKPEVNHINGDKADNRVENLEWCTHAENMRHAVNTGLIPQGADRVTAKFTNEQVRYIRDNPDNLTCTELAAKFGVANRTISAIQLGKTYRNAEGAVRESKRPHLSADVRDEIRRIYVKGSKKFGSTALAKKYGVDPATICNIIHEVSPQRQMKRVPDDVREEIKRLYKRGVRGCGCEALAEKFGISATTVWQIVEDPHRKPQPPRVPDNVREEIRRLYAQGDISQSALAKKFSVSQAAIFKIIHENKLAKN